ncbi:GNAT family N-acetyltransferase [Metabacillus dongyingensis]|uniref:GNAT family N-acetyltransferase n=1 Tax=Metabacillus dongyingensis TaxID=2874282 RepID=UPI003B8D443F
MLNYRLFEEKDYPFFTELISASEAWHEEECRPDQAEEYMTSYKMYNGTWLIWMKSAEKIGISFHLNWAPSNEKPWIGTILIHPEHRKQGLAKKMIEQISAQLKGDGHKAVFAGCPASRLDWLKFLGRCGFEQLKSEKDSEGKEYIITVKPV